MRKQIQFSFWLKIALLALIVALGTTALSNAATNGGYQINWWTADSGGESSGATYTVSGAIGQQDAAELSGATYNLSAGFWGDLGHHSQSVYLPLVTR